MAGSMADKSSGTALKPVSKLATAADLSRKMDSLRHGRQRREREWKLNLAFYRGNQYAYWNPGAKRIEQLPTEEGDKPRYRVRVVSNQVVLGVQSLLSKLRKTDPMWSATPGTPGDDAIKAAEFAEDLLEDWWRRFDMGNKFEDALRWSIIAGEGYLKATWDAYAATEMRYLMDPHTGLPIEDKGLAKEFKTQLQTAGLNPSDYEQVAYMGDLKVEAMSPFDVFMDPSQDPKWVFCNHHLEVDEIETRWPDAEKLNLKPDKVAAAPDEALPSQGSQTAGTDPTLKTVTIGYFKRTPQMPNGRYVVFIEDPDTILEDKKWEYPSNELPVVQLRGIPVPGGKIGDSVVTHARPIQKQLNRLLSQITEYTNMVIKPRVWAPVNSLRQRLTTEPGAVYEYTPVGNMKPEIEQLPSIPPYVFDFLAELKSQLRDAFGLTEVTEGALPPNLEAADAIDLLQEMATDRFVPTILANEKALAQLGQFMLSLAQEYYTEPRLMTIFGVGGMTDTKEFTNADFAGDITVHVEAGSSLPKTRAARRQQITDWMDKGLISPKNAWKYYDVADMKDLALMFRQDEDTATRENDKMIAGTPLNPEEVQKAMVAVNQGMNPETGQPLGPQDNPQQLLLRASLQPKLSDDIQTHLEKHRSVINSPEFDSYDPDVRQRFLLHFELTIDMQRSLPVIPEPQAIKTSLQLRGSVGATTAAEILHKGGVLDADPQVIATEPPLETMITDSIDDPDADANGPGREANDLSQAAKTMIAAHAANADAQQRFANTQDTHAASQVQQAQQMQHAEDTHQQKMRHAEELHKAKVKAASRPPAPRPSSGKG